MTCCTHSSPSVNRLWWLDPRPVRARFNDEGAALSPPVRVLIVEDEYFVALQSEEWLEDSGYSVVGIAASANEAVALAVQAKPDLILMDIRLPGNLDGIEAARTILKMTGIRSLFISAHSDPATRERAATAHAVGFLAKPYSQNDFLRAIRDALTDLQNR